jgi:hypothetical protein
MGYNEFKKNISIIDQFNYYSSAVRSNKQTRIQEMVKIIDLYNDNTVKCIYNSSINN